MDYQQILFEAHEAADIVGAYLPDEGACGFAWVVIPGNHPLARYCRSQLKTCGGRDAANQRHYGSKGYPKGWRWWSPGYDGQSIDAKERAAAAFRDVLAKYGIRAEVRSRLD